jgi:hypothetical protein
VRRPHSQSDRLRLSTQVRLPNDAVCKRLLVNSRNKSINNRVNRRAHVLFVMFICVLFFAKFFIIKLMVNSATLWSRYQKLHSFAIILSVSSVDTPPHIGSILFELVVSCVILQNLPELSLLV